MCHSFWVLKKFMSKRVISGISVEIFKSLSAKRFLGDPLSVSLILGIQNFIRKRVIS